MNCRRVLGTVPLSAPGTDHMRIRRFAIIKTFSIKARLYTAGMLALIGLLVTGASGYIGLTQSNDGLTKSITATSAVLNQMQADMMHDAMRGDVLYALQTGPGGSPRLREQILADVTAHADVFKVSIEESADARTDRHHPGRGGGRLAAACNLRHLCRQCLQTRFGRSDRRSCKLGRLHEGLPRTWKTRWALWARTSRKRAVRQDVRPTREICN